jgi:mannosyl-oligosaccharide alpha-1,2-mannosidase
MASSLNRRRGTRSQRGRTSLLVGLVVALIASALVLGILLGTHLLLNSTTSESNISQKEQHANIRGSPLDILEQGKPAVIENKEDDWNDADEKEHENDASVEDDGAGDDANGDDDAEEEQEDDVNQEEGAATIDDDADENEEENRTVTDDFPQDNAKPQEQQQQHLRHMDQKVDAMGALPKKPYPYNLDDLVPPDNNFTTWTAPGGNRFAEYTKGDDPYIITPDIRTKSDTLARSRRVHVKNAMEFAYKAYETYAFGHDEVLPQSKAFGNNWGGMGTTLVDSLDTLWLMGLKDEFWRGRDWVRDHLHHDHVGSVSVFETTIRSLGGLLSAYDWSGDEAFLTKAQDLGDRLFKAFDTASGLPMGQVSLSSGSLRNIGWAGGNAISAEVGTLQIEYRYLAKVTKKKEYATKSENVYTVLKKMNPPHGLYPYYIRNQQNPPTFANNKLTFGAMSDSLYEYMLKIWLQGGKTESLYREMYDAAIQGMHDELLSTSTPSGLVFIADKNGEKMDYKMDHLVCFMGGLLGLGAYTDPLGLESDRAQRDLKTAKALTYTCYQMYARMKTGISPEFIQFYPDKDFVPGRGAPHYLLRPEAVESFFILNQLTGDPIYREWGWEVFSAIERYCKTDVAYGELDNVNDVNGTPRNKMESFFLAETLKYLYLLQDPDTEVDVLNKHVFNTEAHPLRIFPVIDKEANEDNR